jgi:hypothetical protein
MNDFELFVRSVWRHSIRELTGSAAVAALSIWEHLFGSVVRGWVFLAITFLLVVWAFYKAWLDEHRMLVSEREKHAASSRVEVQNSFNPTFKPEANPSIHLHLGSEPKPSLPPPQPQKPSENKSNLVLMNVYIGPLYQISDIWSKTIHEDWRNPAQYRYQAIYAEIKNSGKPDEEVGAVNDVKAELVINDDEFTPLPWVDQHFNRANFNFGDVKFVVLAVVLPFSKDSADWRIPLNHRDYDSSPGVRSTNFDHVLKRFVERSEVQLRLLHVKSGRILKTFSGTYRWKDGERMPTFTFA